MGTHRLTRIDTADFYDWVHRSGYDDELDFWSSLSGLSSGSLVDHMTTYLASLGYTGTPNDQFRQFLRDQTGIDGTIYDLANHLYQGTFSLGVGSQNITTEDGINITTEDGTPLKTE